MASNLPPDWREPPEPACEVCLADLSDCICPECPVCGDAGNPDCYRTAPDGHGMDRTEEQISSSIRHDPDNYDPTDYH